MLTRDPEARATLLHGTGRLLGAGTAVRPPWALLVRDGRIAWVGEATDAPPAEERVELGDALVTPGLVDAHTHPVFAGDRSDEVAARLEGTPYTGGGILRTVAATRAATDDELLRLVESRLRAALAGGTTTIECKSGYGLTAAEELRALRLIEAAAARVGIRARRTFLGAHAVPAEAGSMREYARYVADEMLPAVAAHADDCDVFCDAGFFDLAAAELILRGARSAGLGARLHAEQLTRTGATELGIRLGALSVDHLERLDDAGVAALAASSTVATLLPGPALLMRGGMPPARALLDAGARVALATDLNAGTYGNVSMPLAIALGVTVLGMNVGEAIAAATAGGAAALGLAEECGSLRPGSAADIVAWDAEHEGAFALHMGAVRPIRVWLAGRETAAEVPQPGGLG